MNLTKPQRAGNNEGKPRKHEAKENPGMYLRIFHKIELLTYIYIYVSYSWLNGWTEWAEIR